MDTLDVLALDAPPSALPDGPGVLGRAAAVAALATVDDPEVGLDLVALGLIYGVYVSEAAVRVLMALTTPACPMGHLLRHEAERALRRRGFADVEVTIVWSPPWSPGMIDAEARRLAYALPSR